MERILLPIVIGGGVIVLAGFLIWLFLHLEKKRTAALLAIAEELGLHFSATQSEDLSARMQKFPLFNKGRGRKIRNVMSTETDLARLTIFDYQYTTGGGEHSQTHRQTVVAMESEALELPNFSLRPESIFHKLGAAIGMQDIDFEEHPEFSDDFVLAGDDEQLVRQFFDNELLNEFAKRKGVSVESAPGSFIYFRSSLSRRCKPEQIREYMTQAYEVYSAFVDRLTRPISNSN